MGVVLSRLSNTGGEVTWYFLFSLLQVEYRRLCHLSLFRRRRRSTSQHHLLSTDNDQSNRSIVSSESIGTQTCENTMLALQPSASPEADIQRSQERASDNVSYKMNAFELCDAVGTTSTAENGYSCNAQIKRSPPPTRKHVLCLYKGNARKSNWDSNSTSARFVFPDVSSASARTSTVFAPKPRKAEACLGQGSLAKARNGAATRTNATQLVKPTPRNSVDDDYTDHDADVSSDSGSASSSGYNDIYIYENPDFTRFGDVYRNLASPSDKLSGPTEPKCDSCVSSLSPVKEEPESDVSSTDGTESLWSLHHEAFPVFDADGCQGSKRKTRGSSSSEGKSTATSGYGKRLLCCSFSTDSGIDDSSRRSNVSSTSEHLCMSSASSESASESDVSCTRSSDISSVSQLEEDLDVFELEHEETNAEMKCCWPRVKRFSVPGAGAGVEVFVDERHGKAKEQKQHDEILRRSSESDVDSQNAVKDDAENSTSAQRQPLQTLSIRARRKVTFSSNLLVNNSSSSSSPDSASPSDLSTTISSSTSSKPTPGLSPVFSRQDSTESNSSTSSTESVLAVPFSPASPTSPQDDIFVVPGKYSFSEPREGCDLTLLVEGQMFYVHQSVVAWQCHVLLLHMRETGSSEVVLPDKRADDILSFLQLLYPFCKQTITDRNVEAFLDLAQTLGCDRVMRMCTTFLMGLAQFPHLCPHRHLARSTKPSHHVPSLSECLQNNDVEQVTNANVSRRDSSGSSSRSSEKENVAPIDSDKFVFNDGNKNTSRQPLFSTTTTTSLCACADTMGTRVLEVLQLAVKYDLDEVYPTYLDVAAKLSAEELRMCSRYAHLSPVTREDILASRVKRLEDLVGNISVRSTDLIGCGRGRHEDFRLTYNGELCLKCMSRKLLREAKGAV